MELGFHLNGHTAFLIIPQVAAHLLILFLIAKLPLIRWREAQLRSGGRELNVGKVGRHGRMLTPEIGNATRDPGLTTSASPSPNP